MCIYIIASQRRSGSWSTDWSHPCFYSKRIAKSADTPWAMACGHGEIVFWPMWWGCTLCTDHTLSWSESHNEKDLVLRCSFQKLPLKSWSLFKNRPLSGSDNVPKKVWLALFRKWVGQHRPSIYPANLAVELADLLLNQRDIDRSPLVATLRSRVGELADSIVQRLGVGNADER